MRTILTLALSLFATTSFAELATPNYYKCGDGQIDLIYNSEEKVLTMNNEGLRARVFQGVTSINTPLGKIASVYDPAIADATITRSLIIPSILLANAGATQVFKTKYSRTFAGGYRGTPMPGILQSTKYHDVECVASFEKAVIHSDGKLLRVVVNANLMPPVRPGMLENLTAIITLEVVSSGCTGNSHFALRIIQNEDGTQTLSSNRIQEDRCRMMAHPQELVFLVSGFHFGKDLIYDGEVIAVEEQVVY
jgi:hypothetical protein